MVSVFRRFNFKGGIKMKDIKDKLQKDLVTTYIALGVSLLTMFVMGILIVLQLA